MNAKKSVESLRSSWVALVGLSAVFLFEMLDNSILNVALPTIGRDLHASTTSLQWITGAYAVVFGGMMLAFGALADKYGRRKIMLIGLSILGAASLSTLLVQTAEQLIVVRAIMGIAAAMTTPGSMALAFKLFESHSLRMRAISIISTVGIIGLAIGPTVGGLMLAVAPWQALILINVPIALLALGSIYKGIPADDPMELHDAPIDITGAILGTLAIVSTLSAPTLFIEQGSTSILPWLITALAAASVLLFIYREKVTKHPIIDFALAARPLVSSGLLLQAAGGLVIAGMSYLLTLQLQLDFGWSPARAAIAMVPQVVTLLAVGPFIEKFVERIGESTAAWTSSVSMVIGLLVFGVLGHIDYIWIALSLVLLSAGLRIVGVVAGINVMHGLPKNRTSIGAALNDTSSEVASAIGIAVSGTALAAIFTSSLSGARFTSAQSAQFHHAVLVGSLILASVASALIVWAIRRSRITA